MKPLDPEVRAILEHAPRPINNTDLGKALEPYFRTVLSSQPEGWHAFQVMIRREEDGSVLLYTPTLKELR